jgi:hypothetical protein
MPFRAETMINGNVCVAVRCRVCTYSWEFELAGGEVAFAAKPDRRTGRTFRIVPVERRASGGDINAI